MSYRVLVVNPGSTSTKLAVYNDENRVFDETVKHHPDEISSFSDIMDQQEYRKGVILRVLEEKGEDLRSYSAIVGRGGLCRPIESGVYQVNEQLVADLNSSIMGKHASSLAGIIAYDLATSLGIEAYIVDPVVVDEFEPLARYSGWSHIPRKSMFHALNQKAAGRKGAALMGSTYERMNLIVAHLGGGITVGVHRRGRVIDVNNGMEEGPFAPERAGGLPIGDLIKACFSGRYKKSDLMRIMAGKGGLVSYIGTNDGVEVERRILDGDEKAAEVFEAMAYQVAKEIGSGAAVLKGSVDAVVLTGGLAHSDRFVEWIRSRVRFIAPVLVFPGEFELESLAFGALRVLRGQEEVKEYAPRGDWFHSQEF